MTEQNQRSTSKENLQRWYRETMIAPRPGRWENVTRLLIVEVWRLQAENKTLRTAMEWAREEVMDVG